MSKHTPTPWAMDDTRLLIRSGGHLVAEAFRDCLKSIADREAEAQANAAMIVRAVNAHDALVEALRVIAGGGYDDAVLVAERALRAAGVEP